MQDFPISYHFGEYYLTFPNARWMSTRDLLSYATSRRKKHDASATMLPRPCGLGIMAFTFEEGARLLEIHQNFMRCLFEEKDLLQVCVTCGNVTYGDLAD